MRLGGITGIHLCSFLSNSATRGGLAVAVTLSATISNSSFDTNELTCEAGSYRHDTTEVNWTTRKALALVSAVQRSHSNTAS